jgi:predicted NBD/HSP70 family sugar kinase
MNKKLITHKKMKHDTLLQIFGAMRSGSKTKREIQRSTGVSWGTCSEGINYLEQIGLIDGSSLDGAGQPGPRTSSFAFSRERFLVMGIEVAVEMITITVSSLKGDKLYVKEYTYSEEIDNSSVISIIEPNIHDFLKTFSLKEKSIYTLQFALTGAVDRINLIWIQSPKFYKIKLLNLNIFYNLFPHVRIVNVVHDIQARAMDRQYKMAMGNLSYVMLHVSDGVGMTVREKDHFILGRRGFAGELGHIPYYGNSLLPDSECFCGQKNCIEHYLHYQKILDYYNKNESNKVERLIDVNKESVAYKSLYDHILQILLYMCRILVDIFDSSSIILGGKSLEPWQDLLEEEFLERLQKITWQQGPKDIVWYRESRVSPSHGACLMNLSDLTSRILSLEVQET